MSKRQELSKLTAQSSRAPTDARQHSLCYQARMAELKFPAGFLWGTASASYQIEGAWDHDGKGESIWDRFSHTPGRIKTGETGDVACDFYHRFKDDIAIQAELGLNASRVSISWPRVMPAGHGAINQKGLDFYRRVADALLKKNIEPWVTLYHWDLPQELEDIGGWTNRDVAGYFADYAATVADALGDRIKRWMVFNEPWVFTVLGYHQGLHAPGRRDPTAALNAMHVVNLAQAMGARALRASRHRPGAVGTAFSMSSVHAASDSADDRAAAERWDRFNNFWFLDTVMKGVYPEIDSGGLLDQRVGAQAGDADAMKEPLDFLGINLYFRTIVARDDNRQMLGLRMVNPEVKERTEFGWEVYPDSLGDMVTQVAKRYPGVPLYITENGCSYGDAPGGDGRVRDERRISYMRGYLAALWRAIDRGADVRGYFTWTLTDNFEWAEGFRQRFGIVHCDFDTLARTIKDSGYWYRDVARRNALDFDPGR
jgi:beta-glucosidase